MALPKLKLCWNGSRVEADWYFGLFGIYTRGSEGGRLRGVIISGRGLLAWLGGVAFVAYFTGAAALWFWLDRRPYNYVTYADLILPTRWSGIQALRGQALVAEGMDDIKAREWGAGLAKLRTGIARNPDEIEGRLVLAEIFVALKARNQAIAIYDGGLAKKYPGIKYVEAMVKSAAQSEDYEWLIRTCDRALDLVAGKVDLAADRKWLIQQKLSALLALDRTDEALALAEIEGESGSPAINEFRVLALLKAGKPAEAVSFLDAWSQRIGSRRDTQVVRLQVRAYREAGDATRMDEALATLRALNPTDPRPYVYGIVQWLLAGRRADASSAFDSFVLRFGSNPEYLQMLAAPLAEIAELSLLEQVGAYARQQGFALEPFQRFLVQSLLGKGEWESAASVLAEMRSSTKALADEDVWREVVHAQIQAALDASDGAQSNLIAIVRGRQFAVGFYKGMIASMRKAGRPETAREIITYAQGLYPQNPEIEAARRALDSELAMAASASKAAITPKRAVSVAANPVAAPREEIAEAEFMAGLDELTKAGDYAGALSYVREIRFAKPVWLGAREVELSRNEVRLSGRVGDMLALRSAVRRYNTGDRLRSAQIIEIARELYGVERKEEAVFLLKELLAKTPDYAVAQRLLAEWTPPPAVKAP